MSEVRTLATQGLARFVIGQLAEEFRRLAVVLFRVGRLLRARLFGIRNWLIGSNFSQSLNDNVAFFRC
jgi:hypothetical protein